MCRPAEISTNCTRSQLKGPCAAVRMAGMTKHGCHRTLRTTCLTHSICILAGCEWVGFWWLLIIYVPQSSIRHHCSKVHCSKLAWFAGAQHPISLLGRDARREDASCLFFGGDGWYPAPNQITIDWGWTCPTPINYNHQWSSNHQPINYNSPYFPMYYESSNDSHGGMVIQGQFVQVIWRCYHHRTARARHGGRQVWRSRDRRSNLGCFGMEGDIFERLGST